VAPSGIVAEAGPVKFGARIMARRKKAAPLLPLQVGQISVSLSDLPIQTRESSADAPAIRERILSTPDEPRTEEEREREEEQGRKLLAALQKRRDYLESLLRELGYQFTGERERETALAHFALHELGIAPSELRNSACDVRDGLIRQHVLRERQKASAPDVRRPACRLAIVENEVFLDGKPVDLNLTAEANGEAVLFLSELLNYPRQWRSTAEIQEAKPKLLGRLGRLRNKLPEALKQLVESSSRKGFRLKPEAWQN
jgi:hypothetical protein